MKNSKTTGVFFAFILMLAFATTTQAQSTRSSVEAAPAKSAVSGIDFFHGTFAEAKAKAKRENKLIFMDAYTTWCGPCKWMAANTFTDSSVGEYFNKNFVNVKMDMERGEGPALQRQFAVRAYPTLLFIDGDGQVKHRDMGAKKAGDFLAVGKKADSKK